MRSSLITPESSLPDGGESRVQIVARWFGIDSRPRLRRSGVPPLISPPTAGQILLITGPSGAGKSTLLRRLSRTLRGRAIHLDRLRLPNRPVIELFDMLSVEDALRLLSRLGLAEAHTYLLPPRQLSTGQRWRLRLALAIAYAGQGASDTCILCDEFAAPLDRITAIVVAHALRRMIDSTPRLSAILATSCDDLTSALRPDRIIRCNFGLDRVSEI